MKTKRSQIGCHVAAARRWTATIATFGLAVSLLVVLGCPAPAPPPPCGEFGQDCGGLPVVAVAGSDVTAAPDPGTASATVQLDGSLSFSREGQPLDYVWMEQGSMIGQGPTPEVVLTEGTHPIILQVTDTSGNTNSDLVTVRVGAAPTGPCGAGSAPALGVGLLAIGLMKVTRTGVSGPRRKLRNP